MSEAAVTSYDEIPYTSKPLYPTHPDCLAVAGILRGMRPASPAKCRVLELGCASGGNLIPMAYSLPESQFVGIDLSPVQIRAGQDFCAPLGLANLELRAGSILDLDESLGQFDYIICHGVYSWVPRAVQDRILWICGRLLAEQGIAYVSYNTYPGWHRRGIARELMRYHARHFDDPPTKVQQARSVLSFMAEAAGKCNSALSAGLAFESKSLEKDPDYYLFHEHLEDVNSPLYFHEFVGRAQVEGLQYLGESWSHTRLDELPADVLETLQSISTDLIDLEQFVDFLGNRTFRRTLLCRGGVEIVRTPQPEVMQAFRYSALAEPVSAAPDVVTTAKEEFRLDDGTLASTNYPILKAALTMLYEEWPRSVPFGELFERAADRSQTAAAEYARSRAILASLLLDGYLAHLVAVQCQPFPFCLELSERPMASAVARLAASLNLPASNQRHRSVDLSPELQAALLAADGTRTWDDLARHLGLPRVEVEQRLRRLLRFAMLVG